MVGGIIADTYLGRFKTIQYSIGIALLGHVLLIISSLPEVLENPDGALACFTLAVVVMGAGTGGFKSNISPLVAEQYTGKIHVRTEKSGERVIVDPALTTTRIYMVNSYSLSCVKVLVLINYSPVLLLVHQHRRARRSNRHDLLRKGILPPCSF